MYELRDYQKEASDAAVKFFSSFTKRNSMIVLPTGSGKSLVIADIAYRLNAPVVIFQPSKEILAQNFLKLQSYGVWDCSVYSASFNSKQISRITFAMIGSVMSKKELFCCFKYAIIDECHLVNAEAGMYAKFIEVTGCKVLGLTATPYRLHSSRTRGVMLRFLTRTYPRVFSDLIYQVQIKTLLERGYLAKTEYYRIKLVDTSRLKVNSTGADYTDDSVREHYKNIGFDNSLENIIRRLLVAGRTSILVFTRFVDEANYIAQRIGGEAAVVSGKTPDANRKAILSMFKAGKIKVVANVGVLTTGFDFPELDTIVLARPTRSLALYYQMIGRGIRPCPGKVNWVVDLCENFNRFGRVDDLKLAQIKPGIWAVFNGNRQLTNVYFK